MARWGRRVEVSGGTVPNSCVGVASFGGKAAFMGKIAEDQFGEIFTHDLRAAGVSFTANPVEGSAPTARCLILVTPDGERTMNTLLGAAAELSAARSRRRSHPRVQDALSGGLFVRRTAGQGGIPRGSPDRAGGQAGRWRSPCPTRSASSGTAQSFLDFIRSGVDLLFANERELLTLV